MATKPKLDPTAITDPSIVAALDKIKAQADAINKESASDMLTAMIKDIKPDASPNQVKLIVMEEFDKRVDRQPKLSADGKVLSRTNKKGETVTIDAAYLSERYADIIPTPKKSQGALEIELAKDAIASLTLQGKLVEVCGSALIAEKLLNMAGGTLGKVIDKAVAKPRPGSNGKVTADNPFSYPLGDKEGDAAVADYIRKFGTQKALAKARELNVTLGRVPMKKAAV